MELPAASFEPPPRMRASAAGFTLVELMVALSLAALLLGLGVPMFRDTIARNRLTEQSNDLVAAITMARSQAITANQRISFCRADSATATACSGSAGDWAFWLINNNISGTVIRRGEVHGYGGTLVVTSTLADDEMTFGSDGLAMTNAVLVAGEQIIVCSTHSTTDNQRQITLGAGSRVSTDHASGGC